MVDQTHSWYDCEGNEGSLLRHLDVEGPLLEEGAVAPDFT